MNLTITPTALCGAVTPPPSKSQSHRLLIAAALAEGESFVDNLAHSQDIDATICCLKALGAQFTPEGGGMRVKGLGAGTASRRFAQDLPHLDCGESGSTLRFLIPVALMLRGGGVFTGRGRLMERPLEPYFQLFREKGISYELKDGVLTVRGELTPGEYRLPGNVSSQFFTGLLFALPFLPGPSNLISTTPLESGDYIAMTLEALGAFGVVFPTTLSRPPQYLLPGNQVCRSARVAVEGDWSGAAFWYAAAFLGCDVDVRGLNKASLQGDMRILSFCEKLRGEGPVELDVSECPDLVPPLAAMAALRAGEATRIVNAERLRIKESDRLSAVTDVLSALGAQVVERPDRLLIQGQRLLRGGATVESHNDHRIAMMAAIAAIGCLESVTILGGECVKKSYPTFWEEYAALGGRFEVSEP